jgi:DNA-binding transcriptional ArsR family regulator
MAVPQEGPNLDEVELGVIFAALSNPTRRLVVEELLRRPDFASGTCSELELEVGKSTMTHHMRTLREAGLITETDYGNRLEIRLRHDELEARFPGLLDLIRAASPKRPAGLHARSEEGATP